MHHKSVGFRAFALCLSLGGSICWATTGWTATRSMAETGPILTIFDCYGSYIKLSAVSGAKVADGFYGGYANVQHRIDGCLIGDVLDEGKSGLFALIQQSPRTDENGAVDFIVATLDVKTLKTLHSYLIPSKQSGLPSLLYDSARQALLVISDDGRSLQRLEIKGSGDLIPLGPASTFEEPIATSQKPYIDDQGNIVAGDRLLNEQGRLIRKINSDSILNAELQKKFSALTSIKGSNQHHNSTMEIASAGNRMVFTVGWDAEGDPVAAAGVMVFDLLAGRVVTSFFSMFPVLSGIYPPSLYLTPDGKKIILEQYTWAPSYASPRKGEELRQSPLRTGVIAIYDADTGVLSGKISVKALSIDQPQSRVVNFSSDNHYLYYFSDQHLYVIDLESAKVVSALPLLDRVDPAVVVSTQ